MRGPIRSRCFALVVVALLVAGCANKIGPIKDPSFSSLAAAALEGGKVIEYSRVDWYEGLDAGLFGAGVKPRPGVVVLLEERLAVLEWNADARAYSPLLQLRYADASDVRKRVYGLTQWFVVAMKNGDLHAFVPMTSNGLGVNVAGTNRALAFLRTKIPSSDDPAAR